MEKKAISDMLEITMEKVKELVDANTIVGEPVVTPDGITLIPVSKLCLGLAGGGHDSIKKDVSNGFSGGIGTGVRIEPVAFIVAKEGNVRLLHVAPAPESTLDRVIDTVPGILDKVTEFIGKNKDKEDQDDILEI
jgi:sporulation protein YtfJ